MGEARVWCGKEEEGLEWKRTPEVREERVCRKQEVWAASSPWLGIWEGHWDW